MYDVIVLWGDVGDGGGSTGEKAAESAVRECVPTILKCETSGYLQGGLGTISS